MNGPYDIRDLAWIHNAELQQKAADHRLETIARSARRGRGKPALHRLLAVPGLAERADAALFTAATAIHWLGGHVRHLAMPRVHFRAR